MRITITRMVSFLAITAPLLTPAVALSQMKAGPMDPPPVLLIQREMVKTGMGPAHAKSEAAWAATFAKAKRPTNWLGMNAISGGPEAWFMSGYPSFAVMEKDNAEIAANATLEAESAKNALVDANYASDPSSLIAVNMAGLTAGPAVDLSKIRYFNIITVHARPGHDEDFTKVATMMRDAYAKAKLNQSWAVYRVLAGDRDGTFLVMVPLQSLATLDHGDSDDAMIGKAMGSDGMAALNKASADGIISSSTQIMQVSPKLSYVSAAFKAGDPSFWK